MLARNHGQTWNAWEIGRSLGLSDKTVRSYLDILTGMFMIRRLQPWHENVGKRQVKKPKIYFRDSGLLHSLLDIRDYHDLLGHPKAGASWEGFALEQILQTLRPPQAYFWGIHSGTELDLMFLHRGKRYGIEIKFSEAPDVIHSMKSAVDCLGLYHLWIVCPGRHSYRVAEKISVSSLRDIRKLQNVA